MEELNTRIRELTETILRVRFTDLELERESCQALLELGRTQSLAYANAFAYTYLGDYYLAQNNAALSGEYLFQARQLCSRTLYPEVYMKACHLSGLYYHVIYDEQNALQYYLEALSISQEMGDVHQSCNAWNNIADMFQRHGQFAEAKRYYLLAQQALTEQVCEDKRILMMVCYNLAEICGIAGEMEEMERYLVLCEQAVPSAEEEQRTHRFCCLAGRCLQACLQGELAAAATAARAVLDGALYRCEDRYSATEFMLAMALALVRLGEADCSGQFVDLLDSYCSMEETYFMKRLVELRLRYAEAFVKGEDLTHSYQAYCHALWSIQTVEDGVRASGMNAKIHLHEVMRQQEKTLREKRRLEDAVHVDELTGICNRRYFSRHLEDSAEGGPPTGIIMLDIDYFKEYNDTYGHQLGDKVLRAVGAILQSCGGEGIRPCRYGGDEFACLCYGQSHKQLEQYILAIQEQLARLGIPHLGSRCAGQVTLSVGYSTHEGEGQTPPDLLLQQADRALYAAKGAGRNGWRRYLHKR